MGGAQGIGSAESTHHTCKRTSDAPAHTVVSQACSVLSCCENGLNSFGLPLCLGV